MGPIINLISETYYLCEMREYTFMVLWEYTIISPHEECALLEYLLNFRFQLRDWDLEKKIDHCWNLAINACEKCSER